MMSEDVYDVARAVWCELCEAPHLPCEPSYDVQMECLRCFGLIDFADEERFEGDPLEGRVLTGHLGLLFLLGAQATHRPGAGLVEHLALGRVRIGDDLLVRERRGDQPLGVAQPIDPGVWKVVSLTAEIVRAAPNARRASRTYHLVLKRPGRPYRSVSASASERFNRVVP